MVIGLIVGFVLTLAVFVGWELYIGEKAMCAPRLVKRHAVPSTVGFFFFGSHIVLIYYIPIYFQSIEVVAAIEPGVRNLLFIIAVSIFTVVSGVLISMTSYPAPFLTVDAALATIRCGLIYTLDIGNSTGKWTGYEISRWCRQWPRGTISYHHGAGVLRCRRYGGHDRNPHV